MQLSLRKMTFGVLSSTLKLRPSQVMVWGWAGCGFWVHWISPHVPCLAECMSSARTINYMGKSNCNIRLSVVRQSARVPSLPLVTIYLERVGSLALLEKRKRLAKQCVCSLYWPASASKRQHQPLFTTWRKVFFRSERYITPLVAAAVIDWKELDMKSTRDSIEQFVCIV